MCQYSFIHYNSAAFKLQNMVLGRGLELLSANGGRFEIHQLLFADDTAL